MNVQAASQRFSRIVVVACVLFSPSELRADSDGYYCAGRNYIAYQFRGWQWFNRGEHTLTVVGFDEAGVTQIGTTSLGRDFQPHAMHCDGGGVRIEGWGEHYIRVHVLFHAERGVWVHDVMQDPERRFDPNDFPAVHPVLGERARPGVTALSSLGDGVSAELVITSRDVDDVSRCEHVSTRVQVRDRDRVTASLTLFEGLRYCEVGHHP